MVNAIRIAKYGGPEVLRLQPIELPKPGPGQALVQVIAAGVNFMDVGVRNGMYRHDGVPPFTPGVEGSGRIVALGEGVTGLKIGDRVAWFFSLGSYAEQLIAPVDALVPLPDEIDDLTGAAVMMQGLTASHFVTETYAVKPGDTALVHSAAGGVGLMLTQMIKLLGGKVIGRVSTEAKAEAARKAGAEHVIVDTEGNFAAKVRELTGGEGVQVVYDGAGADTFQGSLDSLDYHGVLAYYGQTIKRLPPIDLLDIPRSILLTYPTVHSHVRTREALLARSSQLFKWVMEGKLNVKIGHQYALADAAQAHKDLESRRTSGKVLLIP